MSLKRAIHQRKSSQEPASADRSGPGGFTLEDNRPSSVAQKKSNTDNGSGPVSFMPVQRKANSTGLPDNLKSGIENLSGHSMDDVKVHYNSPKPAQLNAHAYAQGTNIHVAPGQEKHVPHEAWHVVQQKQGRVQATKQLKGISVNDDSGLEREADVMGQKALQRKADQVQSALSSTGMKRPGSIVQGVFAGFNGGGWAADNSGLGANMDIFPGGGNPAAGGQQAGAGGRTINIATHNAYAAPQALGGFDYFSQQFNNQILYQPGGAAKRYTHLHVINGKTHGPGTPDNLTLGSTADNNHHRAQAEDYIRNGLPAADSATTYFNQMGATPPFAYQGGIAYWNNAALVMVGAQKAPPGSKVTVGGIKQAYTHSADPANLHKETRWAHYVVNPVYGGAISPTVKNNIAKKMREINSDELDEIENDLVLPYNHAQRPAKIAQIAAIKAAFDLAVVPGAFGGGIIPVITAARIAATASLNANFTKPAAAPYITDYTNAMTAKINTMTNFVAWAAASFPTSLVCDADLYKASYDPANRWQKRSEAQTTIITNNL